jgi:hypothetical protein
MEGLQLLALEGLTLTPVGTRFHGHKHGEHPDAGEHQDDPARPLFCDRTRRQLGIEGHPFFAGHCVQKRMRVMTAKMASQ